MEHVVFYPAADGSPAYRRLASLEEAVSFVEHLRNERDVAEVSVHALSLVPLSFRTVYRVEIATADAVPAPTAPATPVAEDAPAAPAAVEAPEQTPFAPVAEVAPEAAAGAAPEAPVEPAQDVEPQPVAALVADNPDAKSLGFFAS